jgi:hypothetical protein
LYGFFPGVGPYERIRHKFSPSFNYRWSPEVAPTPLQIDVFGARAVEATRTLAVTLNQTFEAKRRPAEGVDSIPADTVATTAADSGEGPRRQERQDIVQLLGLRTSVINYDFVEADSGGSFLAGFSSTRLSNQISSDFLQGLSVSLDHDLFEDTREGGVLLEREFKPHLSQVNFSFALSSRSSIFRLLGLGQGDDQPAAEEEEDEEELFEDPAASDESSIVPGAGSRRQRTAGTSRQRRSGDRSWQANLSYSLQRPRDETRTASQMLMGTVTLRPTEGWDVRWRTAYDLEAGHFNDHTIRLTRDLHRWEAHFDFLQTATGNWQFRFEVSLTDNRDLKFDYQQRNLDPGRPSSFR